MPRNVRNFWVELSVDGAKSRVETGPRNKDGGFHMVILMRDDGGIERVVDIEGRARPDGQLVLNIETPQGRILSVSRKR
jgi:hypothetical protein